MSVTPNPRMQQPTDHMGPELRLGAASLVDEAARKLVRPRLESPQFMPQSHVTETTLTPDNPLTRDFTQRLWKLERFADIVEETLVNRAAALDAELETAAVGFREADRQEFYESHAEDFFELSDELPTILRYSIVTAA